MSKETPSAETVARDHDCEPSCMTCNSSMFWRECYNCDEDGFTDHDCGEDCCCCLDPEPNVRCDICKGKTGWWQCQHCHPWED